MTCLQDRPDGTVAPVHSLEPVTAETTCADFRHALSVSDLSEKAAAYQMGMDPSQLSRALHNDGHLYADKFPALGACFLRAFYEAQAEPCRLRVVSADTTRDNLRRLMHAMTDCLASLEDR